MPAHCHICTVILLMVGLFGCVDSARAQRHTGSVFLAGYKMDPTVPTSASGEVNFLMKNDTLQVKGSFDDLSSPYSFAGIFYGKKGERGNRLFKLDPELNDDGTSGDFRVQDNIFPLTENQQKYLLRGFLYISIHTSRYPEGEIRGQIPGKK